MSRLLSGPPETVTREASAEPWADRSRGRAAFHAIGQWLRRALADSARYWALAAGLPPDLYDEPARRVIPNDLSGHKRSASE